MANPAMPWVVGCSLLSRGLQLCFAAGHLFTKGSVEHPVLAELLLQAHLGHQHVDHVDHGEDDYDTEEVFNASDNEEEDCAGEDEDEDGQVRDRAAEDASEGHVLTEDHRGGVLGGVPVVPGVNILH